MKFHFRFSNLLGTVYRRGNLCFNPDGDSILAGVGNKISVYDLRRHRSETLPVEARSNFVRLALAPRAAGAAILLAATEDGEVMVISLVSRTVLHTLRTHREVADLRFSPDGRHFSVAKESNVFVYRTPGPANREFSPFVMERVLRGAYEDVTCVAWSSCSRIVAVGSRDTSVRLFALEEFENFRSYALGGHTEEVRAVFFERDSLMCYTLSRNGHLAVWESSVELADLRKGRFKSKKSFKKRKEEEEEEEKSEDDISEEKNQGRVKEVHALEAEKQEEDDKFFYKRLSKHFLRDNLPQEDKRADLLVADYSQKNRILATGFSNGAFFVYEMPDCNLLHSLAISEQKIAAISISSAGDWIAFGCPDLGQLLVWEWQSETYVMKQQGHFNNMACLAYSPDGQNVATGGEDGKVKLWSTASGFSFVTFSEHLAGVSGVTFTPSGKVVLSSSLDGSVRAFDMARYRNFRTFTSPRPAQFGCLSVDSSGQLVAAGATDTFEIYLWSMQTGRLLEVISGHEGPVSSLGFSPSASSSMLASASWDQSLRLWNALAVGSSNESIPLVSDATAVAFRPDGNELAVATLNGHITFFDARTSTQTGAIEGRKDLGSGRADADLITAKKSLEGKGFLALCYSADGSCILAGGQSKHICIYHVKEKLLVKKFELTQNRSFDAMDEVISRKKMGEFGNLALVEDRDDPLGQQAIKLPGARKGDGSSRAPKPEVRVSSLQFSPDGRDFAAATTEGLLVYSLDSRLVFDPFELSEEVTPAAVRRALSEGEHARGLLLSLRLNERDLLREAVERVPHGEVELLCADLPTRYVERLARFVGEELEESPHLHFYAVWAKQILLKHGRHFRQRSAELMPVLNLLHRNLLRKARDVSTLCERNSHTMRFLLTMSRLRKAKLKSGEEGDDTDGEEVEGASENDDDDLNSDPEGDELESNWVD